ncbi:MAG: hypothetical protein QOD86_1963 [Miltoncostaeaceae bacterium]|nr:hypothetical protein [Miltoncostaeaceae bacterium]
MLAAAAWTAFVWIGRLVIMAGNDHSAGFLAVHGTLAGVSLLLAVPVAVIGWRMWRAGPRAA